jgi:hypothetical protein
MTIGSFRLAACLLVVAACQRRAAELAKPSPPSQASLVRRLAILATGHVPAQAELDATAARLARHELSIESYIDSLVTSDAFSAEVAPLILLRQFANEEPSSAPAGSVLKKMPGADPIYYLRAPCSDADAQRVRPWWAVDREIRICPDSYRPTSWTAAAKPGEDTVACQSRMATKRKDETCGCGPNLIRCFESVEQRRSTIESLKDEPRRTIAYVVANDHPLEEVFTSNSTFRDRDAELVRRANTFEARQQQDIEASLHELAGWPASGQWSAREDLAVGQNAGILTTPTVVYNWPDRRNRMAVFYDLLWCEEPDSVGATPESVISIAGSSLQHDTSGWKDLAARPLCTNCHARLDYGMQFLWGYPDSFTHAYFVPAQQQTGRGPLYVKDIEDGRGDADLNPRAFAELAVRQPEFRRCMARNAAEYVFGRRVTPAQIDAIEALATPGATSLRTLVRGSLLALAGDWHATPAPAAPAARPAVPSVRAPAASVAVSSELAHELERCDSCHDGAAGIVDLTQTSIDRSTVIEMLENVAFGRMPKNDPLSEAERTKFLTTFIDTLWTGKDAELASDHFIARARALPAYRPEIMIDLMRQHAGDRTAKPTRWRIMENHPRAEIQQLTPGLATIGSLAAIEACRRAQPAGGSIGACLDSTLELENLLSTDTLGQAAR